MFLRFALVLAVACAFVATASAQSSVVLDNDLRVFTTVAALNVAGFDIELASQYHPVRAAVRSIANGLDPDLVRRLKEFYASHKGGLPEEDQLGRYLALALVLTDPPALKPVSREESLPDAAREVLGFAELLREFFQKASITQRWAQLQPAYEAEMDRLGESIRRPVLLTDAYLRVPSGGPSSQTMRIIDELAAPRNSVNLRSNDDSYYVVLGATSAGNTDEIRHAYLHLQLNNSTAGFLTKIERRDSLLALIAREQGVSREYSTNFHVMATESLIRAIELRIDRAPAARAQEAVRNYYRSGLLLTPYFFDALPKYEAGDDGLKVALGEMMTGIDLKKETDRFQQTFHSIPLPERQPLRAEVPAPPPRVDPVLELLRTAQSAFEKDKPRAREAFEKVLKEHNPNDGRALYGLGLIAMDATQLEEAARYFELTLKSDLADLTMKTWAHIYLGRILDFNCDRTGAVDNYRKAIQIGDNTRNAQTAAEDGLNKPYGGGCRP